MKKLLLFAFILLTTKLFSQNYNENLLPYTQKNKFVFCDSNAKQKIKSIYDYAEPFRDGFAIIGNNNFTGVINEKGKIIIPIKYRTINYNNSPEQITNDNSEGVYFSINDDSIFYSYSGTLLLKKPIEDTRLYMEEFYELIMVKSKIGLVDDLMNDTLIRPTYDYLSRPTKRYSILIAKKDDHFGIITINNDVIVPIDYDKITWDKRNMLFMIEKTEPYRLCYCVYHDYPTIATHIFCDYQKIIKKFSYKYMLVENKEHQQFYINIETGKELRK